MIDKRIYKLDYIRELQERYQTDPGLLERVLYAFGLLEALVKVGMKFTFKGGTSLMLLLEHPLRLSTDIDIIVEPGTDVDGYIEAAGTIFLFLRKEEDIRKGQNNIEKRHFKFIYHSPIRQKEFYILLDIVFMESPYDMVVSKPIGNDLLITEAEDLPVTVPTLECILGDKLTAFAPHTTGVPLGKNKELEIAKQLYDVAVLAERMKDQSQFKATYNKAVEEELAFRGLDLQKSDVLKDTIRACICIISRGTYDKEDYVEYLKGCRSLTSHILGNRFTPEIAAEIACSVMCLAASVLTDKEFPQITDPAGYAKERLAGNQYKKLAYIRKRSLIAYGYLVEATRMLESEEDSVHISGRRKQGILADKFHSIDKDFDETPDCFKDYV